MAEIGKFNKLESENCCILPFVKHFPRFPPSTQVNSKFRMSREIKIEFLSHLIIFLSIWGVRGWNHFSSRILDIQPLRHRTEKRIILNRAEKRNERDLLFLFRLSNGSVCRFRATARPYFYRRSRYITRTRYVTDCMGLKWCFEAKKTIINHLYILRVYLVLVL